MLQIENKKLTLNSNISFELHYIHIPLAVTKHHPDKLKRFVRYSFYQIVVWVELVDGMVIINN